MSFPLLAAIIVFVLIFILKMPISLGMLAAGLYYFLFSGLKLTLVANQVMNQLYSNYVLIAVPLFIFTANIMNSGKITAMVFKFANALVGKRHGGLGHVNIVASVIFSGMTGSAIADASGLGKMEIAAMREEGYDDGFSCAITAASATIGPIFPPSIPLVIYAMFSNTSVGELFLGGTLPGLLIAFALGIYVMIVSKKRHYPQGVQMPLRDFIAFGLQSLPSLLTPVILLLGIYTGVMTPTEAGAVAGLYAILISIFAYKSLGFHDFKKVVYDTVKDTGGVSLMVGAAAVISFIVAKEQIGVSLGHFVLGLTDNKYIFLIIVNVMILILGMFIDTSCIQLIFVPILIPLASALGIDLVHFGVMVTLNMMIGLSTPPFGMLLFITSNISGTPLKEVIREIRFPLAAMIVVLLVVTFIPQSVLFIPSLLK
ncbi:TRAP transporter large permease [Treponema sp. HNW]|uniref:TRAP transporter large permease n=1 Tax=Treponema sp. HNW TaxID=3116654 RepID=UPI003D0CA54A